MSQKKLLYTVERRRGLWAVYAPSGKKVIDFIRKEQAAEKAAFLNEELVKRINHS